ncbi:carbohydrate ABC transporter permease [Bifidobacterium sp.]|jgi:multiple sugar transport system permease protein|uniref:carbohydrate ABC transporter permease n=1 Tax=Bifidobacterium sp. TaxID=41200 RepID=UPI0025C1A0A1|nr:carbohydrate ABC transporter permease [Bifidobacterium sp.]MCH4209108.1 carbohydrate ABC transporter permease [Bifidobacterium sp.]MCI1224711.1 carbohydrate ABC transporter permease [Bifidobacterium sp.]
MTAQRKLTHHLKGDKVIAWILVTATIIATMFPFYWMVRSSLTPAADLVTDANRFWPSNPTLINFQRILGLTSTQQAIAAGGTGATINFARYTINSFVYAGSIAIAQTLSSAAAAYAFARLHFKGRNILFGLVLAGLMIPGIFTLLPNFVFIRQTGLLNTMSGIIAPALLTSPFAVFFLRQFFLSIPQSVEEAAMLDGLGTIGRFWRIVLPMSRGPISTMLLITFVGMWKDYMWPMVAGRGEQTRLLTVALSVFQQQAPNRSPDWTGLMAGATLSVIPVIIILIIFGRMLVESLSFSGSK